MSGEHLSWLYLGLATFSGLLPWHLSRQHLWHATWHQQKQEHQPWRFHWFCCRHHRHQLLFSKQQCWSQVTVDVAVGSRATVAFEWCRCQ